MTNWIPLLSSPVTTAVIAMVISCTPLLADGGVGEFHPSTTPSGDGFPGAPPIQYSTLSGPSFLHNVTNTIMVISGTTAIMPCGIKNLHNYTVSWVRGGDIRLLTTSSITYTSDSRFVSTNPAGGEQWILKIHYVRISDAGSYLCQVSTTPPITQTINLIVQEAVSKVLPGPEVHVQTGSRLEIICQVKGCPSPALLSWTRSGHLLLTPQVITYNEVTDNGTNLPVSELLLAQSQATPAHSGTYTCTSKCTKPINVTVHVLRGEELAAMQHLNKSSQITRPNNNQLLSFIITTQLVLLVAHIWWTTAGSITNPTTAGVQQHRVFTRSFCNCI